MDRSVAWEELTLRVESPNLLRHSLAVEAVMRGFAVQLGEDPSLWGIAGLLNGIDMERVRDFPEQRGVMAGEILRNLEADPTVIHAVEASHTDTGKPRRRAIDRALPVAKAAADLLLGAALDHPEKRLEVLTVETLLKRHEALRVNCEQKYGRMEACTELGLSLSQTYGLALASMVAIGDALGL